MRKIVGVIAVAFLAACGSSSSSGSGPTKPTAAASGTISGHTFTPPAGSIQAVVAGGTGCNLTAFGMTISAKAVEIAFNPATSDACTDLNNAGCIFRASEDKVRVVVAAIRLDGGAEPELQPGVYTVASSLTGMQPTSVPGVSSIAFADAMTGGTCPGALAPSASGHVWIDAITGSAVTGAVDITFQGGAGNLTGTFTANLCGNAPPVCDTANALAGGGLCATPGTCTP